jgi:hypothetical protein
LLPAFIAQGESRQVADVFECAVELVAIEILGKRNLAPSESGIAGVVLVAPAVFTRLQSLEQRQNSNAWHRTVETWVFELDISKVLD